MELSEKLQEKAQEIFASIDTLCEEGLNRKDDICEDFFLIAEKIIRIRYESGFLKEFFRWQMNLFRVERPNHIDASISIWSDDSMKDLYPLMNANSCSLQLFDKREQPGYHPGKNPEAEGNMSARKEQIDLYLGNGPRAGRNMFAWRENTKEGWVVIAPDSMEKFIGVSHSLSPLFSRMHRLFHARMLHCAAVVTDGKAILISGVSGSGKSTLAAACLNYGIDYSSDDTILYREEDNMAFPICSTLHISQEVLDHLPKLNSLVRSGQIKTYPGRALKKNLDLTPLKDSFVNGAEAAVMICPKIRADAEPAFEKINSMEALVPLILSSVKLLGIHENAARYMKGVSEKLKELPTYRYYVGPDLEKNATELLRFCTGR